MKRLHQNTKPELIAETLLLSVKVGGIVDTLSRDCQAKAYLIRELLPRAVFKVTDDQNDAMQLLLDRWTYFEPAVILSRH